MKKNNKPWLLGIPYGNGILEPKTHVIKNGEIPETYKIQAIHYKVATGQKLTPEEKVLFKQFEKEVSKWKLNNKMQ